MQTVVLILGLVVFLAVVEQTTGQICSLNYCRDWQTRSHCKCRGCCLGKLGLHYGRCEPRWHFPTSSQRWSCFCYLFKPSPFEAKSVQGGGGEPGAPGPSGSNDTEPAV